MWKNTYPTDEEIAAAVTHAESRAATLRSPVTVALSWRLLGPAFSRVQYEVCLLDWRASGPERLSHESTAYPLRVVEP